MNIHLTCPEIHAILNKYVQEKYGVVVNESFSHFHDTSRDPEGNKRYGHVSFSFDCAPKTTPKPATDNLDERKLDPEM